MSTDFRETLRFQKASIQELSSFPGEKGVNHVLVMKAALSLEAAKVLKCESRFFDLHDQPLDDYAGRLTLKPTIKSCVLKVMKISGAIDNLQPTMIWKFNIGPEKDKSPSIIFRIHFDGYRHLLADLLEEMRTAEFPVEIVALQQNLFADQESTEDGPEGGSRVDMSGGDRTDDDRQMRIDQALANDSLDTGCTSCNAGIGIIDGKHANGMTCTATTQFPASNEGEKPEEEPDPEPTTEQPDESGVYVCRPQLSLEFAGKVARASIDLLRIGPDAWVSTANFYSGKTNIVGSLTTSHLFPTKHHAIAWEAFNAEGKARVNINATKGAASKAWLEIADWFHQQFVAQVGPLRFATTGELVDYIEAADFRQAVEERSAENTDPGD